MLNDIYSTFDSATEIHNVYKVEAIAETYMCVSGVPQANPDHVERIADMVMRRSLFFPLYHILLKVLLI